MDIQRTVTILLPDDDLRRTLAVFRSVQQDVSEACYNDGAPLSAVRLQRAVYHRVKGALNSQMTITALRLVAGAYAGAKRNRQPATKPFTFRRAAATFLVGTRGRDADFRADGSLSIWTVGGRKRLTFTVPQDFRAILAGAKEIDSLTVIERKGRLIGRVVVTCEAPEPAGVLPVGIDLNETNALVAIDFEGRTLFISGKEVKVGNTRTRKAEGKDSRSIRRSLKRLGRTQRNRTRTFAQQTAKRLVDWASPQAVLVFEDLKLPQPTKRQMGSRRQRAGVRRRLSQWQYGLIREAVGTKAQERGIPIEVVDPAYTSQTCSCCGLLGERQKHRFSCHHCGFADHADLNAARNIRDRFTALRSSGLPSVSPEARTCSQVAGKPPAAADGH